MRVRSFCCHSCLPVWSNAAPASRWSSNALLGWSRGSASVSQVKVSLLGSEAVSALLCREHLPPSLHAFSWLGTLRPSEAAGGLVAKLGSGLQPSQLAKLESIRVCTKRCPIWQMKCLLVVQYARLGRCPTDEAKNILEVRRQLCSGPYSDRIDAGAFPPHHGWTA